MEKPTIFFSHSSADKDYIDHLRKIVQKRTSKTVEIFQSSDGESIPFGNNWIHKIEENLKKSKIMLVFTSPKSIQSGWIYFEAGFAYSKGIKVIPIGILGVDIGLLKPPLNLLQGFNISSTEGLNNIIAILNREFSTEYDFEFSSDDYAALPSNDTSQSNESKTLELIDKVVFDFAPRVRNSIGGTSTIVDEPEEIIKQLIESSGLECVTQENVKTRLFSHGLSSNSHGDGKPRSYRVEIDPYCLDYYDCITNLSLGKIYKPGDLKLAWCDVVLNPGQNIVTDTTRLSSLLFNAGLKNFSIGKLYEYNNWGITTNTKSSHGNHIEDRRDTIRIVYPEGSFSSKKLISTIQMLVSARVITQS
ncbi:toll/interleukin-1 receptor domain-containing protein [Pseudomonas sp. YH-1]|uniref:toll/interleukin-1 receptor domain-containing protein n=1 Tax=Pseudomonas sp. YH-1 TaxID=3384787 RepID=UPI003F7DF863